jgi:hypothetical protein
MAGEGHIGRQASTLVHDSRASAADRATRIASGTHTTVAAADTIATGLTTVTAVVVSLSADPVDGCMHASATVSGGNIVIKTWLQTDADSTMAAATTFSIDVDWIAIGT